MNEPRPSRPVARAATADLLQRYDRPGPRYTSYPTAVEFHEGLGPAEYDGLLGKANQHPDGLLSMYMHLPFCEHRCRFCGCHVIATPHKERARPYLGWLKREVELLSAGMPERRSLGQLHLGGGTPTYSSPAELKGLLEHLFRHFQPTTGAELAIEVDPRVTTTAHLDVLADLGFNRLSIGVQDFTTEVQEEIGRVQSVDETRAILEHARSRGFQGLNLDLIYGLPSQKPASFEKSVDQVLELGVDRVALYSFAYVPWIRAHQKTLDKENLPSARTKVELFALARERFLSAGLEPIGMDHFARPQDELSVARRTGRLRRNFQGYTVIPAEDVIGVGISAIGDIAGAYVQNTKKMSTYEQMVTAGQLPVERGVIRNDDDEVRRHVIHQLMCNFRVDVPAVEARFQVKFAEYFEEDLRRLREHEAEGLVSIAPDSIQVSGIGELLVRNLAMCFDRYWREKHEGQTKPIFSRTV